MKELKNIIKKAYPERRESSRKYDYGLVIVIGGSKEYAGSPALSAMAALRSGADITQIAAPQRAADIAASFGPDLITFPLSGDYLSPDHLSELISLTKKGEEVSRGRVAVVIGGGLGRSEETKKVVREYVKKIFVPTVIDADAIYAFESPNEFIFESLVERDNILFTPHLHEFHILTDMNVKELTEKEKAETVKKAAGKIFKTVLLKGSIDYISNGNIVKENRVCVPYLTSGGTGDVLAGIAGALLARQIPIMEAAMGAVAINTTAGELAAKEKGESLIATDVIEKIHKIIN